MTRPPKVLTPGTGDDFQDRDPSDLTPAELEQIAAGDIAMLEDPTFGAYRWSIWRQRTKAEMAGDPHAQAWEFVCKHTGPIELETMLKFLGGGVFHFRGYADLNDGRGMLMRRQPKIALAGARKDFTATSDAPAQPTTAVTQNHANGADPMLVRLLERMEQRLSAIEREQTAPRQTSMKELAETLVLLNGISSARQPVAKDPDREVIGSMVEILQQGIAIGQAREPAAPAEGTDWSKVIENTVPVLSRVLDRMTTRRAPAEPAAARRAAAPAGPAPEHPIPPTPPPPGASSAEVVDPDEELAASRVMVVIDAMARAMANGVDADSFSGTVEDILTDDELGSILALPPDAVIADVAERAGGKYPALASDAGKAYIAAVFAALRAEPDPTP